MEKATLAGGCFWCTEAIFNRLKGVVQVLPGYSGGKAENPSYEAVSTGTTGHAESIQITFDPSVIDFEKLLEIFFKLHDPTTLNRQGNDTGTQYRSAIFYHDLKQKETAENLIKKLQAEKAFSNPIVTEVTQFTSFSKAEDYHLDYYTKNSNQPYCQIIIDPKIQKLYKEFKDLTKE